MRMIMEYAYGAHPLDWALLAAFVGAVWALLRWERRTRGGIDAR